MSGTPHSSASSSTRLQRLVALLSGFSLALVAGGTLLGGTAPAAASSAPSVRVVGNALVDGSGTPVRLLGVNKSGAEFACVQGWGFFDGPVDDATVATIRSWGANAVRVPLNEQCWLGIDGEPSYSTAQAYRDAVTAFVGRLNAAGIIAILDLHWNGAGTTPATSQQLMADADHAADFWRSVAGQFAGNPSVVFDLYNEPHDISWQCWRDGCTTSAGWQAAGMQSLLDAVRSTGATQPVIASGLNWAGDLSQWLAYAPHDPLGQLVAGVHIYNFSECRTTTCWDATIGATARTVPVVTTEVGEDTCAGTFTQSYLDWADLDGVGYTAWTWNTWGCSGPSLISAYDGTPTAMGTVVKARLQSLAAAAPAPTVTQPAPTPTASTTTPAPSTSTAPTPTASSPSPTPTSTTATPTPTPTPTTSSTSTLDYGFETTLAPWRAETTGVTLGRSTYLPYRGLEAMTATRSVSASTASVLRFNTGGTHLPLGAGRTVTAWVRLDSGTPGTWKACLEVQDAAWHWIPGSAVTLTAGTWMQVRLVVSTTVWPTHRAIGIQIGGSRPTSGSVRVRVDEVRQTS